MDPEQYDIVFQSELTHWWYVGMRRIALGLLKRALPAQGGLRLLDAGCGTGGMLLSLAPWGDAVGVDLAPRALSLALKRGMSPLLLASVERLPFSQESFHVVTCFDVLYHQRVEDDLRALREFWRVLRPGGVLLVRVPAFEALRASHDAAVHTRHRYTAPELRQTVESAGFQVERLTYANTLLFPLAAAWRLWQRAFGQASRPEGDMRPLPGWANGLLASLLGLESRWLTRRDLPLGLSVLCLARKVPKRVTSPSG